ncbi:isochorismate synthase [Bacteroides sp. CG01]|uniref:isochorismate synthase n=1 Tax=Bacteroides sp. CG01 TaxID=3096000 RepID=UPI002AFECC82|nr:isochorismate synthase [Bacteroides sp. CG01]
MISTGEQEAYILVDRFIETGVPFAMYRIPGEKVIHLMVQLKSEVSLFNDIEELNGRSGFVIAPFRIGKNTPIVLLRPDEVCEIEFDSTKECSDDIKPDCYSPVAERTPKSVHYAPFTDKYADCFDIFIKALRQKQFDKLVLSRNQKLDVPSKFSPAAAFHEACRRYLYSYVYLCYTPQTGAWLGSTPEIILAGEKNEWGTVALAGTQSLQNGKLPQEWDDKNREEQEYVASYIRSQLLAFNVQPEESGPYPAFAGALSHLKTDFHFSLPDSNRLGDLLKLLHPTPAVCGLPKEKAYQFIQDNEKYDRRYYSGFIGTLNPGGKTDLYVNLRCMNISSEQLTLYAGGGLLASSELEDEWLETEKKMQTMLNLIDS